MATITLKAYLSEIELLLQREAFEEVMAHCRHILQHYPKNVATYRFLGTALLEKSRLDEAQQVFARVLSAEPSDFQSHVGLSEIYQKHNQLTQAIWNLERAFEQRPNQQVLVDRLKELYRQKNGNVPEKIQFTRGALARQYVNGQMYDNAIAELNHALEEQPNRLDLKVLLMETLWKANYLREAGEKALEILDVLPDCLSANRLMARIWLMAKRPQDAQAFLERVEALAPYDSLEVIYKTLNPNNAIPEGAFTLNRYEWSTESTQAFVDAEAPDWFDSIGTAFTGGENVAASSTQAPSSTMVTPDWVLDAGQEDAVADLPDWFAAPGGDFSSSVPVQKGTGTLPPTDDWFSEMASGLETPSQQHDEPVLLSWDDTTEADVAEAIASPDEDDFLASLMDQSDESSSSTDAPVDDWFSGFEDSVESDASAGSLDWLLDEDEAVSDTASSEAGFAPIGSAENNQATGLTGLLVDWDEVASGDADNFSVSKADDVLESVDFGEFEAELSLPSTDELNAITAAARPPSAEEVAELLAAVRSTQETEPVDDYLLFEDKSEDAPAWLGDTTSGGNDTPDWLNTFDSEASEVSEAADDFGEDDFLTLFEDSQGIEEVSSETPSWMRDIEEETPLDDGLALDDLLLDDSVLETEDSPEAGGTSMPAWFVEDEGVLEDGSSEFDFPALEDQSQWLSSPVEIHDWDGDFDEIQADIEAEHPDWLGPIQENLDWQASDGENAESEADFGGMFEDSIEEETPSWLSGASEGITSDTEDVVADFSGMFEDSAEDGASWLSGVSEGIAPDAGNALDDADFSNMFEDSVEEETPSWLSGVSEGISSDAEDAVADFSGMFEDSAEDGASWLSGVSEGIASDTEDAVADFSGMFEDSAEDGASWLSGVSEGVTSDAEDAVADFSGMFEDSIEEETPSWLSGASEGIASDAGNALDADFGLLFEDSIEEEAPSWLSGVSESVSDAKDAVADFSGMFEDSVEEETPSWLSGVSEGIASDTEDAVADFSGMFEDSIEEETPSWLSGVSEGIALDAEDAVADFSGMFEDSIEEETPSWLSGVSENVSDAGNALDDADFGLLFEDSVEEEAPSWLSGVSESVSDAGNTLDDADFGLLFEDSIEEEAPSWLSGVSEGIAPDAGNALDDADFSLLFEDSIEEEAPSWLSGVSEGIASDAGNALDDADFGLLFEDSVEEEAPSWLSGVSESITSDAEDAVADFSGMFEDSIEEETPSWLSGVSESVSDAGNALDDADFGLLFEDSVEEETPSWLSGVSEGVSDAEGAVADFSGMFEDSVEEEAPSWLSGVSDGASDNWLTLDEITPQTDGSNAAASLEHDTDWLGGEELSVEAVSELEVTDLEWLADTDFGDSEAETQDAEDELDWLPTGSAPQETDDRPAWMADMQLGTTFDEAFEDEDIEDDTPAWLEGVTSALSPSQAVASADYGDADEDVDDLFSIITSGGDPKKVLTDAALTPEFDWISAFSDEDDSPTIAVTAELKDHLPVYEDVLEDFEFETDLFAEPVEDDIFEDELLADGLDIDSLLALSEVAPEDEEDFLDFAELEKDFDGRLEQTETIFDLDDSFDSLASEVDFTDTMVSDVDEAVSKQVDLDTEDFIFKKTPPWLRKLQEKRSGGERT